MLLPFMRRPSFFAHAAYEASLHLGYTAVSYTVHGITAESPDGLPLTVSRGNWFVVGPIVSPRMSASITSD